MHIQLSLQPWVITIPLGDSFHMRKYITSPKAKQDVSCVVFRLPRINFRVGQMIQLKISDVNAFTAPNPGSNFEDYIYVRERSEFTDLLQPWSMDVQCQIRNRCETRNLQ